MDKHVIFPPDLAFILMNTDWKTCLIAQVCLICKPNYLFTIHEMFFVLFFSVNINVKW